MTPDQTAQLHAVLNALKKIQSERTSGDWLSVNDDQRMQPWWTSEPYTLKYQSVQTGGQNIIRFVGSEEGIANARAIVASVNLLAGQIDLVEGLLRVWHFLGSSRVFLKCEYLPDTNAQPMPLDYIEAAIKETSCTLSAYLTRATAVLLGLGVVL